MVDLTLSLRDILVAQVMLRKRILQTTPFKQVVWLVGKLECFYDIFNGRIGR